MDVRGWAEGLLDRLLGRRPRLQTWEHHGAGYKGGSVRPRGVDGVLRTKRAHDEGAVKLHNE